jgi:hypothetical protein
MNTGGIERRDMAHGLVDRQAELRDEAAHCLQMPAQACNQQRHSVSFVFGRPQPAGLTEEPNDVDVFAFVQTAGHVEWGFFGCGLLPELRKTLIEEGEGEAQECVLQCKNTTRSQTNTQRETRTNVNLCVGTLDQPLDDAAVAARTGNVQRGGIVPPRLKRVKGRESEKRARERKTPRETHTTTCQQTISPHPLPHRV